MAATYKMRSAIFALVLLKLLLPRSVADAASFGRPSKNTFASASAAGAFTADCLEPTEEAQSSAQPLSLLQRTTAARRQLSARGRETGRADVGHPQPTDLGNESVAAKSPGHPRPTGPSNESPVANASQDARHPQVPGRGNESLVANASQDARHPQATGQRSESLTAQAGASSQRSSDVALREAESPQPAHPSGEKSSPVEQVGADSGSSADAVLQAASAPHGRASEALLAHAAASHPADEASTRHWATARQGAAPEGARSLQSAKTAELKAGIKHVKAEVQPAASASSAAGAADSSADVGGISSTSATVVLFLVFVAIILCGFYLATAELRSERSLPGTSAGDPGKFAGLRSNPQSVRRLPTTTAPKPDQASPGAFSTSPYRDMSFDVTGDVPEASESELPKIYPSLVMPVARTRLAIPIEPLADDSFEVDVLGISGVPLLCAALVPRLDGRPEIQISLNNAGMLLAVVSPTLQLLNAQGNLFGTLSRSGDAAQRYTLRDANSRPMLTLLPGSDAGEVKMVSQIGARHVERASMIRRAPGGRLPAEHYEIVVSPGVDAVVVLACFLALVVLALPGKGL